MNNRLLNLKNGISTLLLVVMGLFLFSNCGGSDDSTTGTAPATSTISITGSITIFDSTNELSSSTSKSVQVNGANLTSDLTINASANYEVSLDDTTFTDDVLIDQAAANAGNTTIYIRFSPMSGAVGNQTGTISFVSAPATTKTLSVSGIGVSIVPIINTNVTTLTFDDTQMNTQSVTLPIVVNGDNLISDINLVSTANFEISLDNVTFSTTTTITAATANDDTTVYARFLPTAVSNYNGSITLQNTDTADVVIALSGNGTPVVHNYVTFDSERLAFGGGFNQSATQTFALHNDLTNIETIKMYVKLRCPSGGCDEWDVYANVKVTDASSGELYELGRYITPYWNDNSQLTRGFEFDVTDFKSLLTGAAELRIRTECWNAKGYEVTVDFDYIEGTPDYPYYAISRVLAYDDWSSSGVPYGVTSAFDLTRTVTIPANAESTHLRTIISGWGHATPNDAGGRGCAEWCYRTHQIKIDGVNTFSHNLGPIGCASNPVSNQSPGNWTPDRAGWCPGMAVPIRVDEFASNMAGNNFTFEYDYENWTNDGANGDAYYATSTFVVVKSNSAIVKPTVID